MKALLLRYLLPGMVGITIGVIGAPWVQRPPSCPQCPDMRCPDNVAIKANPLSIEDVRKFKGDIQQYTTVEGDVYLICNDDTSRWKGRSRSLLPDSVK